ncbi:MAG: CBS domain-containing protein [Myxococcales bacterium]
MAKTVSDLLNAKKKQLTTITPDKSVQDAVNTMVELRIGSLVVVGKEHELVGIMTERDVLRQCAKAPNRLSDTKVGDVMTTQVIVGKLDDSVKFVEETMTARRIRHLPIVEGNKVTGMISIGDVVRSMMDDSTSEANDLRDRLAAHYVVA